MRMVRRGAVELLDRGQALDRLGGRLFGHPSMLPGYPPDSRLGSRGHLCHRLLADAVVPLLARPRSALRGAQPAARPRPGLAAPAGDLDPAQQPVARLVHKRPSSASRATPFARRPPDGRGRGDGALVRLPDGQLGVLTDHDLRDRVVAGGVGVDAPVTEVMSFPAFTVTPERLGGEVMLEMLDRDIRHVPVVWPHGEVLGVLSDRDLLAAETRAPFALRRGIDHAADLDGLRRAAGQLRPAVIALHDAEHPPVQIASIIAVVTDALTRRLMGFVVDDLGDPPCPVTWLGLGSLGRRELVPSPTSTRRSSGMATGRDEQSGTCMPSAPAWSAADGEASPPISTERPRPRPVRSLVRVLAGADRARSSTGSRQARSFCRCCSTPAPSTGSGCPRPARRARQAWHRPTCFASCCGLPSGTGHHRLRRFRSSPRDFVVDRSGEHRDSSTSRMVACIRLSASPAMRAWRRRARPHPERLSSAATAGTLDGRDARTLTEAHDLFWRLRLEHQVEQMRQGDEPDDYIDAEKLSP